jgi:putative peptidoglycan lipid II flippase
MLIPALARRDSKEQKDYLDTIIAGFLLFSVLVSTVAAIVAPYLLSVLFPQMTATGHLGELTTLTRIILLQPILLGLSNILASVTQFRHRYTLYAMSPILYNLGIIVGVLGFYPFFGITGLAWGVVFGAVLHVSVQVPSIITDGFLRRIPRIYSTKDVIDTAITSVPRALALSMTQITYLGLIALAGLLLPGSIAIFTFAYNLQAVPLSVIGASYSVAAFPALAAALSRGDKEEFVSHIAAASRLVLFWSLPATALIIVLRAHAVRIILGSGQFNWNDTKLTAAAFALLSVSLVAQGLVLLLVRGYYASGRTFVPFIISGITAASTVLFGSLFVGAWHFPYLTDFASVLLRVDHVQGRSVLALAFAYTFTTVIGAFITMFYFNSRFPGYITQVRRAWGESGLAALIAGLAAYATLVVVGPIEFSSTLASVFLHGLAGGLAGMAAAALTYRTLKNKEYCEVTAMLTRQMRRTGIFRTDNLADAPEEHVQQ